MSEAQERTSSQSPAVDFEDVSLAFDDKVILDRISFSLLPGHMKIILGASGAVSNLSWPPPFTARCVAM